MKKKIHRFKKINFLFTLSFPRPPPGSVHCTHSGTAPQELLAHTHTCNAINIPNRWYDYKNKENMECDLHIVKLARNRSEVVDMRRVGPVGTGSDRDWGSPGLAALVQVCARGENERLAACVHTRAGGGAGRSWLAAHFSDTIKLILFLEASSRRRLPLPCWSKLIR